MWAVQDPPYSDSNNQVVQAMNSAVDNYYPALRQNAQQWSEFNLYAWYSGVLLEKAVVRAASGRATPRRQPRS